MGSRLELQKGQRLPRALRQNVLVVDDDESMRDLLRLHLSNAGYCVVLAEDALVAGREILSWTPDLLILDVELPYLSGLDFAATLIADNTIPYMPMILMTGHEEHAARGDVLGVDFLLKPFTSEQLLRTVARNISTSVLLASARAEAPVRRSDRIFAAAWLRT